MDEINELIDAAAVRISGYKSAGTLRALVRVLGGLVEEKARRESAREAGADGRKGRCEGGCCCGREGGGL